jgi:Surface lipoprotein assembly modifier
MTRITLTAVFTLLFATLSGGVFAQSTVDQARMARVQGDNQGALALLENALAQNPNDPGLLFERGVVQAEMGRCGAAKRDWNRARRASPTPDVEQAVAQASAHLCAARASGWEKGFDLRVVADPNYNNATSAQTITIGGLPFTLSDDARAQERYGIDVNGRLGYRIGVSRHLAITPYAGVGVLALNDDADSRLRASAGLDFDWVGQGWSLRVGPVARWEWDFTGDGLLSETYGLQAAGIADVGEHSAIGFYGFAGQSTNSYALDSGQRVRGEVYWHHNLGPRSSIRVAASMALTEKEPSYRTERERKLSVLYTTPLNAGIDATFGLGLGDLRGDGVHPVFGVERKDQLASISVGFTFREMETPLGTPTIGITHTVSDSNIPLYTYDKTNVFMGFSKTF